jgi:sarcosine oxidase gamma subunit
MAELALSMIRARIEVPGLTVTTVEPARLWLVSGVEQDANTIAGGDPARLWLAPGRVLVVADSPAPPPDFGFVSNVKDGFVVLEVSGAWRDLLAMGSTLDPALLEDGRSARTMFAGLNVVLARKGAALRLFVDRPLAAWLLDWLRQAVTAFR